MDTVHIRLKFNNMVMTISDGKEMCRKGARFWLPWDNFTRVEAYCKMNDIGQIDNKKDLGNLVACHIIQAI